ncbi:MAG TPA: radical SAM protein, partial [Thermoanaerobaculia bacterium]|nr:radical SAM protein [Thermoanaerobaculia bacterium]
DADLLGELARHEAAAVFLSVTTLDKELARVMEPRTSQPALKLEAIRELTAAGVPVGVMIGPVIPGLTDHEIPSIIAAATRAGAEYASYVMLRLPWAVACIFEAWLEEHFPERKEKILNRVRGMRYGKMYDSKWGVRQRGEGAFAEQIRALFTVAVRRAGIEGRSPRLSAKAFRRIGGLQHRLFD